MGGGGSPCEPPSTFIDLPPNIYFSEPKVLQQQTMIHLKKMSSVNRVLRIAAGIAFSHAIQASALAFDLASLIDNSQATSIKQIYIQEIYIPRDLAKSCGITYERLYKATEDALDKAGVAITNNADAPMAEINLMGGGRSEPENAP